MYRSCRRLGGVAIYDNATQRANVITPTTQAGDVLLDTIQWSTDGTQIYAANNENFDGDFYQLGVSASGVSLVSDHAGLLPGSESADPSRFDDEVAVWR